MTDSADIEPIEAIDVSHSTAAVEAVIPLLHRCYHLGAVTRVVLIRAGSNDTFQVHSDKGRYIFRVYGRRWRSLEYIGYEVELLCHLREQRVPVAGPVPTRWASWIVRLGFPEGERHGVLFEHAPGRPLYGVGLPEHSRRLGAILARLHLATETFRSRHPAPRLDLDILLTQSQAAVSPFLQHRTDALAFLRRYCARLRAAIEPVAAALDWGVCHGDIISHNAFRDENEDLVLYDFDRCGLGWRAFDIGLVFQLATLEEQSELWEAFLSGYRQIRPISRLDLAIVPWMAAVSMVSVLGVRALRGQYMGLWQLLSDPQTDVALHVLRDWERTQLTQPPKLP